MCPCHSTTGLGGQEIGRVVKCRYNRWSGAAVSVLENICACDTCSRGGDPRRAGWWYLAVFLGHAAARRWMQVEALMRQGPERVWFG